MRRLALPVILTISLASCVTAPPNLTPQVTAQFYATETIKYLDAVRDFANAAHSVTPPIISTATLLIVVDWHESIAKTLHATPAGWKQTALTGLDELQGKLSAADTAKFKPVMDAARIYIQES